MNLKKTLATGLIVASVGGMGGSLALAISSSNQRGYLNDEYSMIIVKQIEWDRKHDSDYESKFPELVQAYERLTSREGYGEARKEHDSADKKGDYAALGFFGCVVGAIQAAGWKKKIKTIEVKLKEKKEQK